MITISDFKLPAAFLKKACRLHDKPFMDLPVQFSEMDDFWGYKNGEIVVGKPQSLGHTLFRLTSAYLRNIEQICGIQLFDNDEDFEQLIQHVSMFFGFLAFSNDAYNVPKPDPVAMRLYQKPLVWLLMKDIVGPAFNFNVDNLKVIEASSEIVDVCRFIDDVAKEKYGDHKDEPFIFVNQDIEYEPYVCAHLFYEVLRAHHRCPEIMIANILASSLRDKFMGAVELAFDEKEANDFIICLMTLADYQNMSEELIYQLSNRSQKKIAQMGQNPYMNLSDTWWFVGLIEKMLEPARGPDWSTYKILHPYIEQLWKKVAKEREKRGREGLNYEGMLRVKDKENDPDNMVILEKSLAGNRVW